MGNVKTEGVAPIYDVKLRPAQLGAVRHPDLIFCDHVGASGEQFDLLLCA